MPLDFQSVHLLLEHSGHYALQAVLGQYYYLWLYPILIIFIAGVAYSCVLVWNSETHRKNRPLSLWSIVFAGLLLLSIVSNLFYGVSVNSYDTHDFYTGHLVRPLPFFSVDYANDALNTMITQKSDSVNRNILASPSLEILQQYHMIPPANTDSTGELKEPPPAAVFDKIIIVAVESLDYEFISAVNPLMPANITPNLDKLIRQYPSMSNYFNASQPTSWALTALLMSRLDYTRECKTSGNMSLFTIANSLGYSTMYFAPLSGIFGDNRKTYSKLFAPQIQFFLEDWSEKFGLSRNCTWGISDPELYCGVMEVLKSHSAKRFIAVVSTMDLHPPYTASGITEIEKKQFNTPFLQALHTTDRHLGDFLQKIMADKKLYNERSLIIVTADHAATHGENYLKRNEFVPSRIPLIFITPNQKIFNKLPVNKYASSIDLPPTLMTLIGGVNPNSFMGRDLFSEKNLAFCRMGDDRILVYTPEKTFDFRLEKAPDNEKEKAFADFFKFHYPQQ